MNDKPVIGFIGLGYMGHGMAKNIRQAGYELWVRGRSNRVPVESLLSMGAQEASSPMEMAKKCDIIHICLSTSPQIEAVLRAPDGILAGARPGLIVIDTSTADPASTEDLAKELAAKGGHFVDAPLGGTPVQAEAGQLSAMVGGDEEVVEQVRPVGGVRRTRTRLASGRSAQSQWAQRTRHSASTCSCAIPPASAARRPFLAPTRRPTPWTSWVVCPPLVHRGDIC